MNAYVIGVGTSHFGKQSETPATTLAATAVTEALTDAGIEDPSAIQAAFVGTVFGAPGTAARALQASGVTAVPTNTYESACASGTTAFAEAVHAVRSCSASASNTCPARSTALSIRSGRILRGAPGSRSPRCTR
jgi:acetyl-CoA acetyltransferase